MVIFSNSLFSVCLMLTGCVCFPCRCFVKQTAEQTASPVNTPTCLAVAAAV